MIFMQLWNDHLITFSYSYTDWFPYQIIKQAIVSEIWTRVTDNNYNKEQPRAAGYHFSTAIHNSQAFN